MNHVKRNKRKSASTSQWEVLMVQRYANLWVSTSYVVFAKIMHKNNCGLYRDDRMPILRNANSQHIDRMHKNIIKIFKDVGFTIDVESNHKIVNSWHI